MDAKSDCAQIGELVVGTLTLHAGQPLDMVLLSLAETLARVLAVTDTVTPNEGLRIVELAARKWLASGTLVPNWEREAERVRVQ